MSVKPRYVRETPNMWGYSAQPTTLLYKKDGVCSKLVVDIDAYREGQSEVAPKVETKICADCTTPVLRFTTSMVWPA